MRNDGIQLGKEGLIPTGHVSSFDLIGQAGIDGNGLQLSGCIEV